MAMRDVLPFLRLLSETSAFLPVSDNQPEFFCAVGEDNRSLIKVAEIPKFTPRKKHIALKYHHFRQYAANGAVRINLIDTEEQNADIFTKPLPGVKYSYLRKNSCGM